MISCLIEIGPGFVRDFDMESLVVIQNLCFFESRVEPKRESKFFLLLINIIKYCSLLVILEFIKFRVTYIQQAWVIACYLCFGTSFNPSEISLFNLG